LSLCVYIHLSDLPAFPTRRSSDLGLRGILLSQGFETHKAFFARWTQGGILSSHANLIPFAFQRPDKLGPGHTLADGLLDILPDQDRKSTRLNSSHVSTSYAVFCLN